MADGLQQTQGAPVVPDEDAYAAAASELRAQQAPPAQATPPADEDAYASAALQLKGEQRSLHDAQVTQVVSSATSSGMQPDHAAQVIDLASRTGRTPAAVADDFDAVKLQDEADQLVTALSGQPAVAEYSAQSLAHAALVKGDVPVLRMLSEGLELGVVDIGSALQANKQAKVGLSPEEERQLALDEQRSAAGVPGATTLPRKVGAEIARATPTLAAFGTAALAGGTAGSLLGPAGAATGAALGAAGVAFTLGFGPLYRRLKSLVTDDGAPLLSNEQAKTFATGGAAVSAGVQVAIGAPFLKSLPGVSTALRKVGLDAAAKAAQSTIGRAAIQRLAEAGGHVFSGALAMAGQSAVNAATEEFAKQENGADTDWSTVTDAAVDGFKSGLLLAPLSAFEPARAFLHDVGRIRDARFEAARLDALAHVSKDLGILRVAPAEGENVIGRMAAGTDAQTVYVNTEHLPEEVKAKLADVVGPEAMAEAEATRGDVAVPVAKYLAHLAPENHEALRQDVKLSADGYTLRQAEEQAAHHASPVKDIEQFQLAKIGTGTGLASEGYGLYASSAGDIAQLYLEAHAERTGQGEVGRIYKVAVPADEHLLQYREKLSAQPEGIRKILDGAGLMDNPELTGQDLYKALKERFQQGDPELVKTGAERADQAASRYLDSLGIPGATYPAELAPGGTKASNFVIWRQSAFRMNEPAAPQAPSTKVLRSVARGVLEAKQLGDITPGKHALAAETAGRQATVARQRAVDLLAKAEQTAQAGIEAGREGIAAGQRGIREYKYIREAEWAKDLRSAVETADLGEINKTINDLIKRAQNDPNSALGAAQVDVLKNIKKTANAGRKWLEGLRTGTELSPETAAGGLYDVGGTRDTGEPPQPGTPEFIAAQEHNIKFGEREMRRASSEAERARLRAESASVQATRGTVRASDAVAEAESLEHARDFNKALAKEATAIQKEAETNRDFLMRYTKDDARAELGKAGDSYIEQVDRLLSGFELGQNTPRTETARRLATLDWIRREQDAGREPIIPDSVLSKLDRFVHWKEMTPQEMRDLRSAVESIAHQAETKNTLLERKARADREQGIGSLVGAVQENTEAKKFRPAGSVVGKIERALETVTSLKYGARAVERIINTLDGGDINGPWHRYVWDPINDTTHRWHDLVRNTTEQIVKVIDALPAEDLKRWRETRFNVNGVEYDLSAAVAVALNWGNDSNRQKLVKGWQDDAVSRRGLTPWTEDTPEQFLKQLTAKDWQFVQTAWDRLDAMWPEAAALEKRLTGLEPDKVKPRAFTRTLEDGSTVDLRGGYYPVIYDSDYSKAGQAGEEAAANRSVQLFDRDYYRAATPQGHLQKRIEGFARPILLSLDALPHKISEAAKDTAMREALLSVHSALTDDRVRAALHTSELGRAGEKALLGWLRDTANDLAVPDNGAGAWFNSQSRTRSGYTASIFAYNLGQTAQNLTAIAPAIRAVGPKWMTDAMLRLAKEQGSLIDWMNAQSGELRNHERGGQAVADAMRTLAEKPGLTSDFMQHGMKFFQSTDIAVKYPTWLAAYMKGVAEKADGGFEFDHETAVRHADATVRLNIMAGNTKDLPAILRSKLGRFMLPLYSYNIHRLNMVADALGAVRGAVRERAVGRAAGIMAGAWGAFAAEAVLSELVKGNGPSDENNDGTVDATDTAIWTAKISVLSPLLWIPVLGSAVKSAATGKAPMGTPESTVMGDVGAAVLKTGKVGYNALSEDETVDEEQVKSLALQLLKVGGDLGGVPAQVRTTLGYALDENSPKDDPLQIGLGTAFGKSRPGKLIKLTE